MQLAVRLVGAGIDAYRVQLPKGEDINSFAGEDTRTAPGRLARVLRSAVWLGKGKDGERPRTERSPVAADAVTLSSAPRRDGATEEGVDANGAQKAWTARPASSAPPLAALLEQPQAGKSPLPAAPAEASPVPAAPAETPIEVVHGEELTLDLGERRWRVRGLSKTTTFDSLRVNLMVRRAGDDKVAPPTGGRFHVDTIDLYSARQRSAFAAQAARELGLSEDVIRKDLGALVLRLEGLAEELARQAAEPAVTEVVLSGEERAEAMELLRDPQLLERILLDFERCGVVGEETNKLVAYLAATSRLLDQPLAVVVQSTSAAGKSALLEAVLALMPPEERIKYSAMTGQSLFYMAERDLAHKVLAVVEEEGAERAAYALKLLQSEGELSIASTGKEASTGRLVTHEYSVKGPVAIFLTTTAIDVDEELLNRCLVLSVDEDRDQTRAIHELQRQAQTLPGLLAARDREQVVRLHHNAQRLLAPVLVANPYAHRLTFADERTRSRRDHPKYLTLIRAVALLFQHQRERRTISHGGQTLTYIEVTPDDIAVANRLAHDVLGRSLDELPPQTRRLLLIIDGMVARCAEADGVDRSDVRFTRREVRSACGWGDTQFRCHLSRLIELEYVLVHRGDRGQSFVYELLWDGQGRGGETVLDGLADPATLSYDGKFAGQTGEFAGSSRGLRGASAALSRDVDNGRSPNASKDFALSLAATAVNGTSGGNGAQPIVPVGGVAAG